MRVSKGKQITFSFKHTLEIQKHCFGCTSLKPSFPTWCSIPICVILHYPGSIFECLPDGILIQRIRVLKSYCYSYTNPCLYVPYAFVPSFPGNLFLYFLHSHIVSCYIPMILQLLGRICSSHITLTLYHEFLLSRLLSYSVE